MTLRNHGTVQWTGGRLLHQGGNNTVINESDGTWNVAGANLEVAFAGQPFTNAGQLHKTGSGQLTVGAAFTNTGTIDVDAGELLMSGGGLTNSGVIDVAAGDDAECAPDDVCQRDDVCGDGHDDDAGDRRR